MRHRTEKRDRRITQKTIFGQNLKSPQFKSSEGSPYDENIKTNSLERDAATTLLEDLYNKIESIKLDIRLTELKTHTSFYPQSKVQVVATTLFKLSIF